VNEFDLGIRCRRLIAMTDSSNTPGEMVSENMFLGIRESNIAAIEPYTEELWGRCKKRIDANHHVVLPGLINTHTHLAMTLFRGFEDDVPFHQWLFERILPMENELVDPDFVRVGTMLGAAESLRNGVTTINDMYFYANEIAQVCEQAGIRACVAQVWSNFPLPENKTLGTGNIVQFTERFQSLLSNWSHHSRITPTLGPHAPYTCDDDLFRAVVALSDKTGAPIHVHLSETKFEVEESLKKFSKTPVKRLADLNVLKRGTLCAHAIHCDEIDTEILRESGASVAYNPDSNLKLGSGIAPITNYLKHGIPVGLGTDGAASNNSLSIFGAMNIGAKLQKLSQHDTTAMTAPQALHAATLGGARALGLSDRIGSLEVGKRADLICIDFDQPHLQPINDPVSHLVYSATGGDVTHVICDGHIKVKDRVLQGINTAELYGKAEQWRKTLYAKLSNMKS